MRVLYRVLAFLIATEVAVQAAAIALATSGLLAWVEDGNTLTPSMVEDHGGDVTGAVGTAIHSVNGEMVLPVLGLALLIVAFGARIPGGVLWAGITFGTLVVQVLLGVLAVQVPVLGAVHGFLALVLFGLAVMAGKRVGSATAQQQRSAPV